ncbi:MAG TPA: VacB/RNase II family 3'-5' exoribonuclease, partial [Desulfomonilia bacterium]|nr:VacB/RNase II family 3'-5' exoribonuclease [Desulfomonilia bacterium]
MDRSRKTRVTGKLVWNPKGYAFVDADGLAEGVFIPHEGLNSALDGDLVEIGIWRERKGLRGKVISIIKRARLSISGRYVRMRKFGILEPVKPMPYTIVIPLGSEGDARNGDMVSATIIPPRALKKVSSLEAKVDRSLDIPEGAGDDLRMITTKYGIAWRFPEEVEREAERVSRVDMALELSRRRDLRDRVLFTIDGVNARDFDDAVGIERLGDSTLLLTVAIADVANVVKPGAALDKEARERSFSVYFPETAIPMLPEVLSNGVMSLKPYQDRLALVVEIILCPRGKVISHEIFKAIIRSRARLTYDEVGLFLDGKKTPHSFDDEIAWRLKELHKLSMNLYQHRRRRGSLDFDRSQVEISTNETGKVEGITRFRHGPAERLIEEAMLLTNQTVCTFLVNHCMPVLFRVHEKPKHEDLMELQETLSEIGVPSTLLARLRKAAGSNDSLRDALRDIIDTYRGKPLESFVNIHILKSLKRARYSPEDLGHFGLACTGYLHFTSPIRRYPDLVVHRLVKAVLASKGISGKERERCLKLLNRLAPEVSDREKLTDEAMMEAVKIKAAAFMTARLGEEFEA